MKQVSGIHALVLTLFAGSIVISWTNHSDNLPWNPVGYLRVERSGLHHVAPPLLSYTRSSALCRQGHICKSKQTNEEIGLCPSILKSIF